MKKFFVYIFIILNILEATSQTGKFTDKFYFSYDFSKYAELYYSVPMDYNPEEHYSLIIAWYGCGLTPDGYRDLLSEIIASQKKVIIVAPVIINQDKDSDYDDFNSEFFKFIKTKYTIDSNNIIISGFSWGGRLAFELALNNPENYAGIIGLAPATHQGIWTDSMWSNISKLKMAVILGEKDENFPYVDSLMNDLKARGANLLYLQKPNVYHIDTEYYSSNEFAQDFRNCYDYIIGAIDVMDNLVDQISFFPNPVNNYIYTNNLKSEINYEIYNILGYKVLNGILRNNENKIDIQNLSDGVYYIKIFSINLNQTVKIIKNY